MQLPLIGQLSFFLQSHDGVDLGIFLLTRNIFHATIAYFNWVTIKDFVQFICTWKMFVKKKQKKIVSAFVLTLLLKRGLNHIMFFCMFLLDLFVVLAVYYGFALKPLFFIASSYTAFLEFNTTSFDKLQHNFH